MSVTPCHVIQVHGEVSPYPSVRQQVLLAHASVPIIAPRMAGNDGYVGESGVKLSDAGAHLTFFNEAGFGLHLIGRRGLCGRPVIV